LHVLPIEAVLSVVDGAVASFVSVRVGAAALFPAASAPVTTSVGELAVPALQLNRFETYGPPAGVDFTSGVVCVQPVAVPPSAAKVLEAGPEVASVSVFWIEKEPELPAPPR
jgi:hypothetical protein